MKYIFYITICLSLVTSIYFVTKCDDKCTQLKIHQSEIQMKQAIEQERIRNEYLNTPEYIANQQHKRELEVEKAKNEITVRRETEQVITERLLERGTDIGVNVGLRLLGF